MAAPPAAEERYYYADGHRIPLVESERFVALRAPHGAAPLTAALSRDRSGDPATPPDEVIELPEQGLVVVRVTESPARPGAAERMTALHALADAGGDAEPGPPVYETPDGGDEALIPTGEVIVKFEPPVSEEQLGRVLADRRLTVRETDYPEPGAYLVTTEDDAVDVANALNEQDGVAYAEPNFAHLVARLAAGELEADGGAGALMPALDEVTVEDVAAVDVTDDYADAALELPVAGPEAPATDPAFASQWGLHKIRAPEAWDISMGDPSVSVAILDEGCDMTHEDLAYKLPGYDAYDGDNNPQPAGNDAHGTACAGIATALANNGRGGAGVAPKCRTLPVRIAKGTGGGFWDTTSAKVADAIRKAVDRGADVLSNSYSVSPSSAVTSAFQYAQAVGRGGRGCVIAAATGNGDMKGVIYPARLSPSIRGFLAVGASNQWDQRKSKTSSDGEHWWGSNWGPEVDCVAPGVKIHAPDIMGSAGYAGGNYTPAFNGTSSATPHAAGLAALILSVDPALRSWEVEDIIKLTARDLGTAGRDEQFGFGRIDARRALEAASKIWYQIRVVPVFLGKGRECFMRINVRMFNPGINSVRLDSLTVRSHTPDWSSEVDRFEYRPSPGGVMAPRTSNDVRCNRILLQANGTQAGWSYRWSLNWTYTFWRPTAPAFPLGGTAAGEALDEGAGQRVIADPIRGSRDRRPAPTGAGSPVEATDAFPVAGEGGADTGDRVTVDRETRSITIVIR